MSDPAGAAALCAIFRSLERKRPTGSSKTRSPGARPRIFKPVPWAPRWWCHAQSVEPVSLRSRLAARLRLRCCDIRRGGSTHDSIVDRAQPTPAQPCPPSARRLRPSGRRSEGGPCIYLPRDHREEESRYAGRRPEVDLRPHLLLEPAQRHRLVERRSPQDRLGGEQRDPPLAERSGHYLRRPRQAHEPPRRSRREVEALHHVVLEALEAELAVETALQDLSQDASDLEVHPLEEPNGRAEPAIELEGRGVAEIRLHRLDVRRPGDPIPPKPRPANGAQAALGALRRGRSRSRGQPLVVGVLLDLRRTESRGRLRRDRLSRLPGGEPLPTRPPRELHGRGPLRGEMRRALDPHADPLLVLRTVGHARRFPHPAQGLDHHLDRAHGAPADRLETRRLVRRRGQGDDLPRHGPGGLSREDRRAQSRQIPQCPPHASPFAHRPCADADPLPAPVAEAAEAEFLVGATLHEGLGQHAEARPHRRPRANELAQPSVGVAAAQEDEGGPGRAANRRNPRLASRRGDVRTRAQCSSTHRSPWEMGEIRSLGQESRRAV